MNIDKYLDMNDDQLDNLLLGLDLNNKKETITDVICISCKSTELVTDTAKGHLVCSECGVINKEYLDENPEMSNNDNESNTSCYGAPTSHFYPISSLGTKIVSKAKGYNRLSFLQKQGQMPYKEKSLMDVLETIQYKCKKYGITQTIIDSAKILYKKVSESVHVKGKRKGKNIIMRCVNRRSMIAACLFFACKLQKEIRSTKEIADLYDLEIKHVNRGCRKFCEIIDIVSLFYDIKSSQSSDFIERFSKKLNIDKEYIKIAKDVSDNIHKLKLATTHEPPSVAAGCILLVVEYYKLAVTKPQISEVFDISDVTISKTYKKIYVYHKIILSNTITNLILERKNKENSTNKNELIMNMNSDESIDSDSEISNISLYETESSDSDQLKIAI